MRSADKSIPAVPIRRRWLAVLSLLAVLLIFQNSGAVDPLLYAAKDSSTTGYHQDLVVTGDSTRTDAALVLQEWATSLNLSGQVLHDIKLRDLKTAESGYQQYVSSGENFKDLVVRLDMTDTDVATFQDDNRENIVALHDLMIQIKEYDGLQDAETTFRDQKNISGLKSVELRGEALRTGIRRNFDSFAERSRRVIAISQKVGLDTSVFERSVTDFAAILDGIDTLQDERSSSIRELIQDIRDSDRASGTDEAASATSLNILPDHGAYGDTLLMTGASAAPAGTVATIFVDGLRLAGVVIDHDGRFSFPYRIEQVEAGVHTAYASIDSEISDVRNFTVASRSTTLTLTVRPAEESGAEKCFGTGRLLTQDGVPVQGAPVYLGVDGQTSWECGTTGADGVFTLTTGELSPRTHTLKAQFDPGRFPLNGSESEPVRVVVSSHLGWLASLVYLLGIGGAAIGGVLFLRKRHTSDAPPSVSTVEPAPAPNRPAEPPTVSTIEEARTIADQFTVTNEDGVDGYETIARTYSQLVRELEAKSPKLQLRSRTPRKLAAQFADQPYGDQLAVLVEIHERVRYAKHEPTDEDIHRAREAFIDVITEGSGH
jgi:hypothetical protein